MAVRARTRLAVVFAAIAVLGVVLVPTASASAATPIVITDGVPRVTKVVTGTIPNEVLTLTAAFPSGTVSTPGVTLKYQWYRKNRITSANTTISGATHASYKLTLADAPYTIWARITVSKSGYTTLHRD